jgi:hypothetical protein
MRNASAFWAIVLILVGVLFLLNNFGLLPNLSFSIWNLIWPIILIALGVWFISRTFIKPEPAQMQAASVPLDGASRAEVEIQHGAGELTVRSGASAGVLAEGMFGGGLKASAERRGELLDVEMKMAVEPAAFLNWSPGGYDWDVRLNANVPITLECETGASKSMLDLSDLKITELKLETGASATEVALPASAGYTRVKVQAGAARVDLRVPGSVAARIRASAGLASVTVDQTRFPGFDNRYQSPDYDSAANKVDIDIETGVGAVTVS